MILAIDTETSGLPAKGAVPGSAQYPWPVQIGAVLFGFDGHNLAVFHSSVRAEGRSISAGAQGVHGVSSRQAAKAGVPELVAVNIVCHFASEAKYFVGYNAEFDRGILESSLIRLGKDTAKLMRPGLQLVDLMRPAAQFCKIPSDRDSGEYRWPKLDDALAIIRHDRRRDGPHNALKDALAAKRLFLSLHHRRAFDIPEAA